MTSPIKTVAAVALAAVLSLSAAASASAGSASIQTGGATGCCRMNIQ